jgi:glucose-1-phosphate adenylyltransferase
MIDFALSNCVNSGISDVIVLAQFCPHSLIDYIGNGYAWDLNRAFSGGIRIYGPYKSYGPSDWFLGTADAVHKNIQFIKQYSPTLVLILSGDHIYKMDYTAMIDFHFAHQSDFTLAASIVSKKEATRFGVVSTNSDQRVTSFLEKPAVPPSNLVNMGVYLTSLEFLEHSLFMDHRMKTSGHDFGKDILPSLVREGADVYAYPFKGYWADIGTIESYWLAHMKLLHDPLSLDLNDQDWMIHTRAQGMPPTRVVSGSTIIDSLISEGCTVASGAIIEHSILSPGVRVMADAVVRESILLDGTVVGPGAVIDRTIVDKHVTIGEGVRIGRGLFDPQAPISLIARDNCLPPHMILEAGSVIDTDQEIEPYRVDIVHPEAVKSRVSI